MLIYICDFADWINKEYNKSHYYFYKYLFKIVLQVVLSRVWMKLEETSERVLLACNELSLSGYTAISIDRLLSFLKELGWQGQRHSQYTQKVVACCEKQCQSKTSKTLMALGTLYRSYQWTQCSVSMGRRNTRGGTISHPTAPFRLVLCNAFAFLSLQRPAVAF